MRQSPLFLLQGLDLDAHILPDRIPSEATLQQVERRRSRAFCRVDTSRSPARRLGAD